MTEKRWPAVWYQYKPQDRIPDEVKPTTDAVLEYLKLNLLYDEGKGDKCMVKLADKSFAIGLGDTLSREQLEAVDRIILESSGCKYSRNTPKSTLR